ncbi:hypothetical protein BO443_140074 [Burkholderia orbicola]
MADVPVWCGWLWASATGRVVGRFGHVAIQLREAHILVTHAKDGPSGGKMGCISQNM